MEIPIQNVLDQLRSRLSDIEYENAVLRAQVAILSQGLIPVEESEADLPVPPLEEDDERPAPDKP